MRCAAERGGAIGATAVQIFTKQPSRWAEPVLSSADAAQFRAGVREHGVRWVCAHDSYLINLATPDPILATRSHASFVAELRRAATLELDAVVSHPGNATDGDRIRGLEQNAALLEQALRDVPGVRVLLETTAGAGNALGARFEELAEIIERIPVPYRDRVGICFDTCHAYVAGYDLRGDYPGVMQQLLDVVGIERVGAFHLNDALGELGSRRDRHAGIGEGMLGPEPFERLMTDPRFEHVPKVLETPKGKDPVAADLRNLGVLRGFARNPAKREGYGHPHE